jgi:hypothetical protein
MNGFDYVRTMRGRYRPRTPRAALIAAEEGILPIEAIVYKAASVKPLFEEPYDPNELERVLAQGDLSFADAMLLSEIFAAMTRGSDKELALFAAESLTALENRWARKVDKLRAVYESGDEDGAYGLARALYEEALIAGRSAPIRNYYLREAYYTLSGGQGRAEAGPGRCNPAFNLRIRCLLNLGLLEQAEAEISAEYGRAEYGRAECGEGEDDGALLALAVEAAYCRRDVHRIKELLKGRDLEGLGLAAELKALLASWQGRP